MDLEGREEPLTEERRVELDESVNQMTGKGLRVLALAYKPSSGASKYLVEERDLILEGLVGLWDPPRPETKAALLECNRAGIRAVMATGDHANTAVSIARAVGLANDGLVIAGRDIDKMTDEQLRIAVSKVGVFARVTPEHKLRIVRALKAGNQTIAVTGDGVNDGPALKEADIGIAMGTGTDVAKEASAITIVDDNFATIVDAVKEGGSLTTFEKPSGTISRAKFQS